MTGANRTIDDLAVFGGAPLFPTPLPVGQLATPPLDRFLTLIRGACESRRLTNDGPLVRQLEKRLAALHGVRHCVALANAGLGLTMLVQILAKGRRGEVAMPAFSFRGLPHFVGWAGQKPCYCDVDAQTHALDPDSLDRAIVSDTTCILAVGSGHAAADSAVIEAVGRSRGLPVILDSVYRLGTLRDGLPPGSAGCAEVFSLHATKLLNGFEGGYVTTNDDDLAGLLRWQRNFCYPGAARQDLESKHYVVGWNAKLNEFHAAMALAGLDQLPAVIARNRERFRVWSGLLGGLPGLSLVTPATEEQSSFELVLAEVGEEWPLDRDQTVRLLRAEGLSIHAHYSPLLPVSFPHGRASPPLTNAERLSKRFFHLPAGEAVLPEHIEAIGRILRLVAERGATIASRLCGAEA